MMDGLWLKRKCDALPVWKLGQDALGTTPDFHMTSDHTLCKSPTNNHLEGSRASELTQ